MSRSWSGPWYIIICPRNVQLQVRQANKYSAFLSALQGTKASPNTQTHVGTKFARECSRLALLLLHLSSKGTNNIGWSLRFHWMQFAECFRTSSDIAFGDNCQSAFWCSSSDQHDLCFHHRAAAPHSKLGSHVSRVLSPGMRVAEEEKFRVGDRGIVSPFNRTLFRWEQWAPHGQRVLHDNSPVSAL